MSADSGTYHLGHHGWLRLLVAAALVLVLILTLEASPAAGASRKACRVTNTSTGQTYTRLQQAVKAAKPGARLVVKGRCKGGAFIDKDLAIVGKQTKRSGKPMLDGGLVGAVEGSTRVLVVKSGVTVNIRGLVVRGGRASRIPDGGGISSKGKLTLRGVVVLHNYAEGRGGGIYNEGVLRVLGASRVKGNSSGQFRNGPAVFNLGNFVLGGSSRIVMNSVPLHNEGTVFMNGASNISRNTAFKFGYTGPTNRGTFIMNERSSITEGRVFYNTGRLVMNDESSIHDNTNDVRYPTCNGDSRGGGVYNTGSLVMNDSSSIYDNVASGPCFGPYLSRGGGVYNEGSLTMTGASRITESEAGAVADSGVPGLGGGLSNASGGTLNGVNCAPHTYANVDGNTPDDCYFE